MMHFSKKTLLFIFFFTISFLGITQPIKAVTNGSYRISAPNGGEVLQNCLSSADIFINTGSNISTAADIIVNYDPSKLEIIDSNRSLAGKQIKLGTAFESYLGNTVDESRGVIRLTGVSFNSALQGEDLFASIIFRAKAQSGSTTLTIGFEGASETNTKDSNISIRDTSLDALGSVQNQTLTFKTGNCGNDTEPPIVEFINPVDNQNNVVSDQQIEFTLTDLVSGIDVNSIQIIINGVIFNATDPGVQITGDGKTYKVIVKHGGLIKGDSVNVVLVKSTDLVGNATARNIIFNLANATPNPPNQCTITDNKDIFEPPFKDQITDIQDKLEQNAPEFLKPVIKQTGLLGLITLLAALPLLVWLLSSLLSFLFGGLFFPFLWALLISGKTRYGRVVNANSKKGIMLASITLSETKSGRVLRHAVTTFTGNFTMKLNPGEYLMRVVKKGFEDYEQVIYVNESGYFNQEIDLAPLVIHKELAEEVQFSVIKFDPRMISAYGGLVLAFLNLLFVRTITAFILLAGFMVATIFVTVKLKFKRKP